MKNAYLSSICAVTLFSAARAWAGATGVSDDRVSLPDGPGSVEGIGENVEINPNMGAMSYRVPIDVPKGFPGVTPELALSYSSSSGVSVVGIGWSFDVPAIERTTYRGLPEFKLDDELAADGGAQLVLVSSDAKVRVYRARFEKEFSRYEWHDAGTGTAGYFVAKHADGRIGYYGADRTGALVDSARVTDATGRTFRYMLVELVDIFGNTLKYQYTKTDSYPLVSKIGYVYTEGKPRFSVEMTYEAREDVLSDCSPGFDLQLKQRLSGITVRSGAEAIRRYALAYEAYASSGGFSRLTQVTQYGVGDVKYGVEHTFGYSKALGGACAGECEKPFVVDMGKLPNGVNMTSGRATLIDMNGDSLPDFVISDEKGTHSFLFNRPSTDGKPKLDTAARASSITPPEGSAFRLGVDPTVQPLDVNGDGFTDLVSAATHSVLCNYGEGEWSATPDCLKDPGSSTFPTLTDTTTGDGNPTGTRFFDYDNDKRIDIIRTDDDGTRIYRNDGGKYVAAPEAEPIGAVFDVQRLELADMNGDGMQDPVQLDVGNVLRYRLNLGFGRWGAWTSVSLPGIDESDFNKAQIEDINGDGLADVVVVSGAWVAFALNRNGNHFDSFITIKAADVTGELPVEGPTTTILFADMNGNGSDDIVWVDNSTGSVKFLELFPVRPNLLSRIENGLGMVQTVAYGTGVAELARDAGTKAWTTKLPTSMNVVVKKDSWVTLTGGENGAKLHEVELFRYSNGFYDGKERRFRGFSTVERELLPDGNLDSQEGMLGILTFDVGAKDPYYNGLLLGEESLAAAGTGVWVPLSKKTMTYGDCLLSGIPATGLAYPIRFICDQAEEVVHQERQAASAWVTTRTEHAYNGYGQLSVERKLGDVKATGDELTVETTFIEPGVATSDAWVLDRPSRKVEYGIATGPAREELTYYDGDAFVGLEAGKLTRGAVTRVTRRVDKEGTVITTTRNRYDTFGNVVESIGPNGSLTDTTDYRRKYTMDASGLNTTRVEVLLTSASGEPYSLQRDYEYEATFNKVSRATAWTVMQGGKAVTPTNASAYRYDAHGRIVKLIEPGDEEATPSQEYTYELGNPWTRIGVQQRSVKGGALDIEEVRCLDGKGRTYQKRIQLAPNRWEVDGFQVMNSRGKAARVYEPYDATSGACDPNEPTGVSFTTHRYDGTGREILVTFPDSSTVRTDYLVLGRSVYDENDTDPNDPAANTPTTYVLDGLDRITRVTRSLPGGKDSFVVLEWDSLGRLAAVSDALGNRRIQEFDLVDRAVKVTEPNYGVTTYVYDAAGNPVSQTNGAGEITRNKYDAFDRLIASWRDDDQTGTRSTFNYDWLASCANCSNGGGQKVAESFPVGADLGSVGYRRFGYDASGNEIFSELQIGAVQLAVAKKYDGVNRLLETVYPDGYVSKYVYDGGARVTAVSGVLSAVEYDARGLKTRLAYANGVETKYGYDARRRLVALSTVKGTSNLQALTLQRDRVGNLVGVTDAADSRTGRLSATAAYGYDALYRLLSAKLGDAAAPETLTYAYDEIDNITSATSDRGAQSAANIGAYTYSPTQPNAVSSAGTLTLKYDGAGRLTGRGGQTLKWDHLGRLVSSTKESAGNRSVYAGDETRVAQLEDGGIAIYVDDDFVVRDGVSSAYVRLEKEYAARVSSRALAVKVFTDYDKNGLIDAADAYRSQVAGGTDVDALLKAAARAMVFNASEKQVALHTDPLGSVALATLADGSLRGEQGFYPYGAVRYGTGWVDEHGFTGQELDPGSGFVHFQHRYLDPNLGRWASPDPKFALLKSDLVEHLGESTVPYGYVANGPMTHIDPDGLAGAGKTALMIGMIASLVSTAASIGGAIASACGAEGWGKGLDIAGKGFGAIGKVADVVGKYQVEKQKDKEEKEAKRRHKEMQKAKVNKVLDQIKTDAPKLHKVESPAAKPGPNFPHLERQGGVANIARHPQRNPHP